MAQPNIQINFGKFEHISESWNNKTYSHPSWSLIYELSPGGICKTRHETVILDSKHIYLIPPELPFTGYQKDNPKQFYLFFETDSFYEQVQPKVYGIRIDKLLSELLDRIFKEIQPEPHFLSKPGMLNAIALASSALAQIPQEYITKERIDPRVEEALRFLRSNTNVDIKVQEIADECGMSLSAFTRLFKSETGQSPYQYLTDLRMNWACEILLSGNSPMENRRNDWVS